MDNMTLTALWWAVIFAGFYHGVNPGMGWPLAVSSALMERKRSAMAKALAMLATGHFPGNDRDPFALLFNVRLDRT